MKILSSRYGASEQESIWVGEAGARTNHGEKRDHSNAGVGGQGETQ